MREWKRRIDAASIHAIPGARRSSLTIPFLFRAFTMAWAAAEVRYFYMLNPHGLCVDRLKRKDAWNV